ncbi:hypothetical protein BGZ59_007659 [Podila verticillata]|nr:hypothetical protein BGZ59_007659 [Podila verticillata]
MSPGRKPVLADITHRPQGRTSTPSSPLSSATCSVPGDENRSPARSLLEIFAAVNNKKRSLKLTSTDYSDIIANEARNLAVGDEDGSVHIVDTKADESHPAKTLTIAAHKNAIFDLCWSKDDKRIITASGDKTAKLHDVETQRCIGTFSGHNGTLKSVSMKHCDDKGETIHRPANKLQNVHSGVRASPMKRTKQGDGPPLDGSNTASAVQYMVHNEHIVASTGTQDGSVKYWDVRKHGSHFKVENPTPLQTSTYVPTTKRSHGLVSMALSPDGSALYAVSSDNHVYMYNATNLGSPIRRFSGENFSCSSYYIKISVSPDGDYVATGSSKDLYVWEVNRPEEQPLVFEGPEKEVSGVDWAKDIGNGTQLSACSDDATVRTWKPAVHNPNPVMPISVKATFAQEGVFFAGERLNCTITFTNSGSPASSNGAANGQGTHPARPSSTLQQKLLHHHQEQQQLQQQQLHQQNQHHQQHEVNGANGKNQHRDKTNAASPTSPSSISPVTSPLNSPLNAEARTQARSGASQVQNVGTPNVANENGNRPRRPSHEPLRTLSQARLSSDISHIDAMPRESDTNKGRASVDQDDQTDQDDDTASVIVTLPRNDEDNASQPLSSPTRQHPQGVSGQEEAQQASSPGLLGLATFVYRSASFSSLANAFGLSGGEPEPEPERLYGIVRALS